MFNVEKLVKDLKSKDFPEARLHRILGEELGFVKPYPLPTPGEVAAERCSYPAGDPPDGKWTVR